MKIIYFRETLLQSISSDIFSASIMIGSLYLNHRYIGDNWVICVIVFMYIVSSGTQLGEKFNSKQELLDYLNKKEQK